jgi:hypothetical protein
MTGLGYILALLRFHNLRQALICTAPFALFSQMTLLNVFWVGGGQQWYNDFMSDNVVTWIGIGVVAWVFLAASFTNRAIARGQDVVLGISLRSRSPATDRTAYWFAVAITIVAFLGVFAYAATRLHPGNLGMQIALATVLAGSAALLVIYDVALLIWLGSGFRNCPERKGTLSREESMSFAPRSRSTERTRVANHESPMEGPRKGMGRAGGKTLAELERQRAELLGKSIPEIGGILGRKLGARLPRKPQKPDA